MAGIEPVAICLIDPYPEACPTPALQMLTVGVGLFVGGAAPSPRGVTAGAVGKGLEAK